MIKNVLLKDAFDKAISSPQLQGQVSEAIKGSKNYRETIEKISQITGVKTKEVSIGNGANEKNSSLEKLQSIGGYLYPNKRDYNCFDLPVTPIPSHKWLSNDFFKALDSWFQFSTFKKDFTNKEDLESAFQKMSDFQTLYSFYQDNSDLTEYQKLAKEILDECKEICLGKSLVDISLDDAYKLAGLELKNLYNLHEFGISNEKIKAVYSIISKRNDSSEKIPLAELSRTILFHPKINQNQRINFINEAISILSQDHQVQKSAIEKLSERVNKVLSINESVERLNLSMDLSDYGTYTKIDANEKKIKDARQEFFSTLSQLRPTAYMGETIVGKSPLTNFDDLYSQELKESKNNTFLSPNQYLKLLTPQIHNVLDKRIDLQVTNTSSSGHFENQTEAYKWYQSSSKLLFINSGQNSSRRHCALKIDNNKILLRRCSESYQINVARLVKGTPVIMPTFENQRLELEPGDLFYVGNIEFQVDDRNKLTTRKIKEEHSGKDIEELLQIKSSNTEDLYLEGALAYKLSIDEKNSSLNPEEEFSTETLGESLFNDSKKITDLLAKSIGGEWLDLASYFTGQFSKKRL